MLVSTDVVWRVKKGRTRWLLAVGRNNQAKFYTNFKTDLLLTQAESKMCWTYGDICTEPSCSNMLIFAPIVQKCSNIKEGSEYCERVWHQRVKVSDSFCKDCIKAGKDEAYRTAKALAEKLMIAD